MYLNINWKSFVAFIFLMLKYFCQLPEFDYMYYLNFVKVIFSFFMIFMHVLLFNLLIAMMGNTYHIVLMKAETEYKKKVIFYFKVIFYK